MATMGIKTIGTMTITEEEAEEEAMDAGGQDKDAAEMGSEEAEAEVEAPIIPVIEADIETITATIITENHETEITEIVETDLETDIMIDNPADT
jgi:hypothetical protein